MNALREPEAQRRDMIQHALGKLPAVECPLVHRFTPGLYTREIFMPAGTAIVSRIHKTEHPYVVLTAGAVGITKPGTRRVLYVTEDCRWLTFHPTTETDMDKLQAELTDTPDVSYFDGGDVGPVEGADILNQLRDAAEKGEL